MATTPTASKAGQRQLSRHLNKQAHAQEDTRLDRIRRYYYQERAQLSEADDAYRRILEHANQLLCAGHSEAETAKMLQKEEAGIKRDKARIVVQDALELFGDITIAAKRGLRRVLTEQFMQIAKLAHEAKDLDQQRRALEAVVKLNNLQGIEEEVKNRRRRVRPMYTTDPKVLKEEEDGA